MKPLILIGGGGHCRSCIDVIEAGADYEIKGIIDVPEKTGTSVFGYPILGDDTLISGLIGSGYYFLITVGFIKSAEVRKRIFDGLVNKGAKFATVIAAGAQVSKYATIGVGSILMHQVTVNAGARIGVNNILNSNCLIEHDSFVGNHCHISTHAVLNGGVIINDECFVGSNSVIVQEKKIASGCLIGAGSVVIDDIDIMGIYVGNPATRKK